MPSGIYARYVKRLFDILISLIVFILFWWVYVLLALAVIFNLGTTCTIYTRPARKRWKGFQVVQISFYE